MRIEWACYFRPIITFTCIISCSRPATLLPESWQSLTDVEEIVLPDEVDVKPLANADGSGPRRPRPAGRVHSLLRVASSESRDEAYIGIALLRLEMLAKDLVVETQIPEEGDKQSVLGVNAAGGLEMPTRSSHPPITGLQLAPFMKEAPSDTS